MLIPWVYVRFLAQQFVATVAVVDGASPLEAFAILQKFVLFHLVAGSMRCGELEDTRGVFDKPVNKNVFSWIIMRGGYAKHNHIEEAMELFQSNVPKWDPAKCNYFLNHPEGHLEEAKLLIDKMPVEPNGATWTALLSACRTYGNVELGNFAANELRKLEPMYALAHVLLLNICAATGKWEEVLWVRRMMQDRGVCKELGRSWIEGDNKVYDFVVGDTSHREAKKVITRFMTLS